VISNVILHLNNDLPIVVDMLELPGPADRNVRCTNVRTVDGKRPQFVHDRESTFVFPMAMIRLIEAPAGLMAVQSKSKGQKATVAPADESVEENAVAVTTADSSPDPLDQYDAPNPNELPALPAPAGTTPPPIEEEEPDEDLLARIRSA